MKRYNPRKKLPSLVTAYRVVAEFFTMEFVNAPVNVILPLDGGHLLYLFSIENFGSGSINFTPDKTRAFFDTLTLGAEVRYQEFFRYQHGNNEIMTLLRPLLIEKLRGYVDDEILALIS